MYKEPHNTVSAARSTSVDLNALLEFSRLLHQSDDLDRIYGTVLLSLMGRLRLGGAAIAVPVAGGEFYMIEHARGAFKRLEGATLQWHDHTDHALIPVASHGPITSTDFDTAAQGVGYALPIRFGDRTYGVALLRRAIADDPISSNEEDYALLLSTITAIAVEGALIRSTLHDTNRRLERRIRRLHSVFESGRAFVGMTDPAEIVRLLGFTLMGEMALSRFALYLKLNGDWSPAVNRFKEDIPIAVLERLREADGEGNGGMIDKSEWPELYGLGIRAVIPLRSKGETEGTLLVGERMNYPIDMEDIEYLGALGGLAISSLENSRLMEEMIDKRRLEEDLRIAWEIQQELLPSELPEIPGYEIAAGTLPARQVGGDFYDVIALDDGSVLIAIADVSGKGTPASLLMANVQAAIRTLAPLGLSLGELVGRINDVIHDNTAADKFITAFFGLLHPDEGRFEFVNAGHNPPFLLRGGAVTPLKEGGIILGVMPTSFEYEVGVCNLQEGDALLLYTDGVSEAMNEENHEYGEGRLIRFLEAHAVESAEGLLGDVRYDVQVHVGKAAPSDDVTVLVVRRS